MTPDSLSSRRASKLRWLPLRALIAWPCVVLAALLFAATSAAEDAPDEGIVILEAEYGANRVTIDVRERLQGMVNARGIDVTVSNQTMGRDPISGMVKSLRVRYRVNGEEKTATIAEDDSFRVILPGGPAPDAADDDGPAEGLVILEAEYGAHNRTLEVRERLQRMVNARGIEVTITKYTMGGDPIFGSPKTLKVRYRVNGEEKTVTIREDDVFRVALADGGDAEAAQDDGPIVVLRATYGPADVTDAVRSHLTPEGLELVVGGHVLGGDPAPGQPKELVVHYRTADGEKTQRLKDGERLVVRIIENADGEPATLFEVYGLEVLKASYGTGEQQLDVTGVLNDRISAGGLGLWVHPEVMGKDPARNKPKTLTLTLHDRLGERTVTLEEGAYFSTTADRGVPRPMPDAEATEAARARFSDSKPSASYARYGIEVLEARWGFEDQRNDLTEQIADTIDLDGLTINVHGPRFGGSNPSPGKVKDLRLIYRDAEGIHAASIAEYWIVHLPATRLLELPPAYAAVGRRLEHNLRPDNEPEGVGFKLIEGPAGASVDADGALRWTPAADQAGDQWIRIEASAGDRTAVFERRVTVITPEQLAKIDGDLTRAESLFIHDLGAEPYAISASRDTRQMLVVHGDTLDVLGEDGFTRVSRLKLPAPYDQIIERPKHYVALAKESKELHLLDKQTGEVTKRVELPYRTVMQLAPHPTLPLCYVVVHRAGEEWAEGVMVDETTGAVREPDDFPCSALAIAPDGKSAAAGVWFRVRSGTRFHVAGGRLYDFPEFDYTYLLLIYELDAQGRPVDVEVQRRVGGGVEGVRISADSRRASLLSRTGFPKQGQHAAWLAGDLELRPVTYAGDGIKADTSKLDFHPVLPLAVVHGPDRVRLFRQETGEVAEGLLPEGYNRYSDLQIIEARFAPGGRHLVLVYEREDKSRSLVSVPLTLSPADERALLDEGGAGRPSPDAPPRAPGS